MRASQFLALAFIPAWIAGHAVPAAAQSFDDRWSIIPKAHAEPAPPIPERSQDLQPAPSATVEQHQANTEHPQASLNGRSHSRSPKRVFSGKASFYSYPSGKTANGENFDRNRLTAAHRSLPFGTRVRVTALSTGKSVVVRITDRGPAIRGRVLDLSMAAARSLGMTDRGVTEVRAEVL
jgi:rare lipoprotein A